MIKVPIKGNVVDNDTADFYNFFDMQNYVSPNKVEQALNNANGQDIIVEIASQGGDVFAGSEIYSMLKAYQGKVTVNIVGLAASIASVIAMAGDEVNIAPTAQIMIHQAWSEVQGNTDDMQHQSKVLSQIDQSIINAYVAKTGLDNNQLLQMMSNETWLTAQDAVDKHFADSILFNENQAPVVQNATGVTITGKTLDIFKNMQVKLKQANKEAKHIEQDSNDSHVKNNSHVKNEQNLLARKIQILRGEK